MGKLLPRRRRVVRHVVAPPSPPFIPAVHHGGAQTPTLAVQHATVGPTSAGAARGVARMWNDPSRSPISSAHYVTDEAESVQCVGDHVVAFHCGHNTGSLGFEMCFMPLLASLFNWLRPKPEREARMIRRGHARIVPLQWFRPSVRRMFVRNADLTAQACLAYGIPLRWRGVRAVRRWDAAGRPAGLGGITTHAVMSKAFRQSTHWDPGLWPKRLFLLVVRRKARRLLTER